MYAPQKLDPHVRHFFDDSSSACEIRKMMHTAPKLDTPCPKSFRQLLNLVHLKK